MKHTKVLSALLLLAVFAAACAPQAPAAKPQTLTVLAAASLTESFTAIGKQFEAQNPGVTVSFNFAGSQQLAQQLEQGAQADIFASASKKYMDAAVESKRIDPAAVKPFARNRLVVIHPKDNPAGLQAIQDLAKPGLKLDLADASVPVGQYALDFLDKAAKDAAFDPQFKENVLKNVVSYENNVKAVVTKVSLGEVDAGIVYATDVTPGVSAKIASLSIPDALNTVAVYPIAPITDSQNSDLARAFAAFVLSPAGQAIMTQYNFTPITP